MSSAKIYLTYVSPCITSQHQDQITTADNCARGACGKAEMIGWKKLKAHYLPYMALLIKSTGEPICRGTLFSSRLVLTHCHKEEFHHIQ
ncbi:unnamed protein product [Arctogadus glacialis]